MTGCPECGAPAEVQDRTVLESTDGPMEHYKLLCLGSPRHAFNMPVSMGEGAR